MFKRGKAVVIVRDRETGEVIERNTICVESEEGVPMGCEAGGPRPLSDYSLIEAIKTFPDLFLYLGFLGILGFVFIGFLVALICHFLGVI